MYLSDIKRDDRFEGYLIVRSAEQRASANGKNYLDMTLADKSGSINATRICAGSPASCSTARATSC